jgi:hypothetical protein
LFTLRRLHEGQCSRYAIEDILDVDIDHSLPLFNLKRGKRRQAHQSGIGDQNIDASEPIVRRLDELIHLLALRHIDLAVVCRAAALTDFRRDLL